MSDGADPQERARPIKLPLPSILLGAFTLPFRHFGAVGRVAALPMLTVIACTLTMHAIQFDDAVSAWTIYAVYALALCWLAVSLHRLVLSEAEEADADVSHKMLRLMKFFGCFIAYVCLRFLIPILVVSAYALTQTTFVPAGTAHPNLPIPTWVTAMAWIVTFWISGRVLLVFPAIAVDQSPSPIAAWQLSRGNGWRLAIIAALPLMLEYAISLLWRDGATSVEFAILVVLMAATTIVTVVALSLAYYELTKPAPPPAEPSAEPSA